MGAVAGRLFAAVVALVSVSAAPDPLVSAIIGMSATAVAIVGGPLTMSFLALETTGNVSLTLGELPNSKEARANSDDNGDSTGAEIGKLGLTLAPAARVAGAGSEGVVVTGVDSSGAAAEQGFATGDVILEVAGKAVSTPGDVRTAIAGANSGGKHTVLVRVKKGDNTRFVALPVGNG